MCLAVPANVIECEGGNGLVDMCGNRVRINTLLVPEVRIGDWVLVHAGFAIQKIDLTAVADLWPPVSRASARSERT